MLTSLNRVYLGGLYPTDILASYCIGANWVSVSGGFYLLAKACI